MAKRLRMLDEAAAETREAWLWYRRRNIRASDRFQLAFEAAVASIQDDPERAAAYLRNTQFVPLKRFPYIVIYRNLEHELQIVAIAHTHRRRGYWKKRLT